MITMQIKGKNLYIQQMVQKDISNKQLRILKTSLKIKKVNRIM
jgi:hypothetical protein